MSKPKDPLAALSGPGREKLMKSLAMNMLGPIAGPAFVKQMEAAQQFKGRQIGDHPEPEKNFWKGHWRIFEIE